MLSPRKGTETLRRGNVNGCAYSLIDKNGVDYFNGVAVPTVKGNARVQIFSAIENLGAALEELYTIFKVRQTHHSTLAHPNTLYTVSNEIRQELIM